MILIITVVLSPNTGALGQSSSSSASSSSSNTTTQQTWIDKLNNLKIQFGYLPTKPIIDAPTQLKFSVHNLQSGEQLKNLSARAVVLNNVGGQQRSFKFTNITAAPDGTYSVKYLFPDSGLYQVITKIDSNGFTSLASFNVSVPFAPLGTVNVGNLNPIALPVIAGIIAATVGAAALILTIKKKNKKNLLGN
ncbi:MAG: hypothetical protein ACJ71A_12360 [Nitrososphaeraceae archaeon]